MTVREAMGSQYVMVRDTDSVLSGLKRLVKEGISGAVVISADSQLLGMVTEFDLLLAIDHVGEEFPISRVMHKDVISIRPDATLEEARHAQLPPPPVVEDNKVIRRSLSPRPPRPLRVVRSLPALQPRYSATRFTVRGKIFRERMAAAGGTNEVNKVRGGRREGGNK